MEAKGHETLLVHGSLAPGEESLQDYAEGEGAKLVYVPELVQPVSPGSDLRASYKLARLIRSFKPDVVCTHTAKGGFVGRLAALTLRPRPAIVHTYHGHVLEGYFGKPKTAVYLGLEKAAGRVSDRLLGVSQATVDDLVRLGVAPRDRFSVLPLGLDLEPFTNLDPVPDMHVRRELGIESDDVLFSFVGRIVPIKRLDLMLDAMAVARSNGCKVQLAVIGDGESRGELELRAESLGIDDSIHFLGYRRDLATIAAASDASLLCSDNEGTPVSLIEASAAARPAVATNVGGVNDVVTDQTGFLVPPDDPLALAAGIERLVNERDLRLAMGLRARKHAIHQFSADRLIDQVDCLFRQLVRQRGGPWPR